MYNQRRKEQRSEKLSRGVGRVFYNIEHGQNEHFIKE